MKTFGKLTALVCTTALCAALAAGATGGATRVTADLRPDIAVSVDGVVRDFYNAQGQEVHPILYNGTTYLPVRAIGELMGKDVTWDGETNTVYLTGKNGAAGTDYHAATSSAYAAQPSAAGEVTLEQAKQTALDHAGVSAANATFIKAERDYEKGCWVYEVEFVVVSGNRVTEYDYELDAATGKIVSYDYDIEGYFPAASGTAVSAENAKQTALARVPGATEANLYEWKYDFDDGRGEYEGKIFYNGTEYEFTIDAATGTITEWEVERLR